MWDNNARLKSNVAVDDFISFYVGEGFVPTPAQALIKFPNRPYTGNISTITPGSKQSVEVVKAFNMYNSNANLQRVMTLEQFTAYVFKIGHMPSPNELAGLIDYMGKRNAEGPAREGARPTHAMDAAAQLYLNNVKLRNAIAAPAFFDLVRQAGVAPTPDQVRGIIDSANRNPGQRGGQAPTRQELETPVASRSYVSYYGVLGPHKNEHTIRQVTRMVNEVYNSNGGKGPNAAQNRQLVGEIKDIVASMSTPKGAALNQPGAARTLGDFVAPNPQNTGRLAAFQAMRKPGGIA
jgi:hypothetical protein